MKVNQLKVGVILSYISMFVSNIISIIYTPIMLRILGQSEYGTYNLAFSVISYLGLLSFGFGSSYIRFYTRYKKLNDDNAVAKLNGMFITIFSLIAMITVIAGIVLIANVDLLFGEKLSGDEIHLTKILMIFMVFNIAVSFIASVFESNVTANEQYVFQRIVNMLKTVINPLIALPLLLCGYRSISLVVATTIITLISLILNILFCFKKLKMKFIFKNFDFCVLKEIAIFSSFIFINMITDQISWSLDKFLLGMYQGSIAIAVYSVGSQINSYYMSFSTSVSSVFIPRINNMIENKVKNRELTNLFTRVGRIQFIILSLILSGFIFFGGKFIKIWAGDGYNDSYIITLLLIVPVTIPLIQTIGLEILRAKNMHKFRSIVYLLIAVGNLFISIPLCKIFGGIGSAMGTAISLVIGNGIVMNIYYHKKVGLDIKYFWHQIIKFIPSLIIPVIVGIIMTKTLDFNNIIIYLLCGAIYCVVFGISMWYLGMNEEEKLLISGPVSRIISKFKNSNITVKN